MKKSYKSKYEKYKQKKLEFKMVGGGEWPPSFDTLDPFSDINTAKSSAHKKAYELLLKMDTLNTKLLNDNKIKHGGNLINFISPKIATAESLTAGLMFSTLVDLPFGGAYKYGCFGVYDADAKRIFIGVNDPNVYTHNCAKQMAIGTLLNSNATIGIAVTGNAMPVLDHEHHLGEVFVGIASYIKNNDPDDTDTNTKICVETYVINLCNLRNNKTCKLWYDNSLIKKQTKKYIDGIRNKQAAQLPSSSLNKPDPVIFTLSLEDEQYISNGYNDFQITSIVAQWIRNYTTSAAFHFANKFIDKHLNEIYVPETINNNYIGNEDTENKINPLSSNNKIITNRNVTIICNHNTCDAGNFDQTTADTDIDIDLQRSFRNINHYYSNPHREKL